MSLDLLYALLGEVCVQVLCPFLIGLFVLLEWSHASSLYILEITPLSEVSLADMFSHMVGSLFILMLFSLPVQKLFILMGSHLFILSFMALALGDISMKILLCGISEIFPPMFSFRTFIVSRLIFKFFIFTLNLFLCMVLVGGQVSFFAYSCPDLPTRVVEEAIFTVF